MTAILSHELFAATIELLPRLFLFGAPVLAALIGLAAFADSRLPQAPDGSHPS